MRKEKPTPQINLQYILFTLPFQPAKITAHVTGAPRGPWPSLRDHTTAAESLTPWQAVQNTNTPPASPLFPRTRKEQLGVTLVKEASCLPNEEC